jgi:hypothetical protein
MHIYSKRDLQSADLTRARLLSNRLVPRASLFSILFFILLSTYTETETRRKSEGIRVMEEERIREKEEVRFTYSDNGI